MKSPSDEPGAPKGKRLDVADLIETSSEKDSKDDQIAQLEAQVLDVTNQRYEERFLWIILSLILFDSLIFRAMENWTAPVVIGLFQLIGIVIVADRCKVDAVAPLIDRIAGAIGNGGKRQS